jgi:hypothetical protein
MRIDSSGNVGIGISSPSVNLEILGASVTDPGTIKLSVPGQIGSGSVLGRVDFQSYYAGNGTGTWGRIQTVADGQFSDSQQLRPTRMEFYTTAGGTAGALTERMRINSAGELLIGTVTDNGAFLLQVNSQIWATNATIATSDARLKENIAPISNALATVNKIQAVAFGFKQGTQYNFDTARQTGFIAQDLQTALEQTDYKDSIVKECGQYLGVAYEKLVPVLVAAIQEQQQIINDLKARIETLEAK